MEHQPFEEWIFNDDPKSDAELKLFIQHLQECNQCDTLNSVWKVTEKMLRHSEMVEVPVGFSSRFAGKLAFEKELRQQRQSRIVLGATALSAVLILTAMILVYFSSHTLGDLFIAAFTTTNGLFQAFINIRASVVQALIQIPLLVWIMSALAFFSWVLLSVPLWGLTVWKLSKQGV
jgi:hypothetical protein